MEEEKAPAPAPRPNRVYSCRKCSKQFSTKQGLGGHQNSHIIKKKKQKKKPTTNLRSFSAHQPLRPPLSTTDLQPIVYNGPPTILHANDHNRPVTMFGDGTEHNPITWESDGQEEVTGLEGKEEEEDHLDLSLHLWDISFF